MKKRTATQASGKKKLKHVHIHSWFSGWRAVLPQFFSLPFFSSLFSLHFDCLLLELHTLTHTFLSLSPSIFSIIHSSYFNLFFSPPIYTNERDVWKRSSLNVNYIIARTMTMVCSRVYLLFFCFGMLIRKENEWPCFVKMSRMIFSISEGQYWFVKTSLHTLRSYIHFVLLLFPVQISLAFVE